MKQPDENKLSKLYGQNDAKKKAYRRGWNTVGKTLEANRKQKKGKDETAR